MARIIALAMATALGVSSAFAGNLEPVMVEPIPVEPVATGGMGNYVIYGLGAAALVGAAVLIADDDDNNGGSSSTTTTTN